MWTRFLLCLLLGGICLYDVVAQKRPALPAARPLPTTPPPVITAAETVPAADQWLQPGDRLQVRLVGTPGLRASFLNGKPLVELPPAQAQGKRGVYQGTYVVQPTDTLQNRRIEFELLGPDSVRATTFSKNRIRFLNPNAPQLALTKGELAYLNYGLGEDRLGGAKLGYLDSAVVLHLTGRVGNQYRVQLSETQTAWIPQEVVRLLPPGGFVPSSLTGSWSVYGDSVYDYVRLPLTQRLPYRSQLLTEPSRLVVDVFGATSNTNWITQREGLQAVGDVTYEQLQPDVFRMVLHLRHRQSWGYHIGYRGNTLEIRVKRPPRQLRLRGLTVAIDAGHGGTNVGATSASGAQEKDLTLAIALKLRQALEQAGARVLMTRTTDVTVDNADRVLQFRRLHPDVLISIHVNSAGNTSTQGTSTYYRYLAFRPLSVALYEQMRDTGLAGFGNVGSFNFGLNGPTEYPNALVETAFLSNPADEKRLTDPQFQQQMAVAMKRGLEQFLRTTRAPGPRGWLLGRPALSVR
ncbi:N-acetylmuramoyl-L-alanine amidase [Hymenobacter metallilatus]|uniref:N-acetylmuramoyl-L-alanine amidase n=1 Tax=Hymenobacter metallilatus TaxID=2493666 RepID=A0A428JTI8_9BACT|nr:N-acetylmuramoyl-L-alanine amidase [Hymenobacter metallilatus]RSK37447.1 N-acetylmuramoyl-L-alanine amidase [Hymenobacter metallilatus]